LARGGKAIRRGGRIRPYYTAITYSDEQGRNVMWANALPKQIRGLENANGRCCGIVRHL